MMGNNWHTHDNIYICYTHAYICDNVRYWFIKKKDNLSYKKRVLISSQSYSSLNKQVVGGSLHKATIPYDISECYVVQLL